jgi:hypothetical protein
MHTSFSQTRRPGGYPSPRRTRPISPFLLALVSAAIGRRVSRWGDRSIRDRPAALVGHQPVNEPRAFSSTTRPTGCLGLRTPKQTSPSSGAQARLPGLLPADHSSSSYVRGGFGLIATNRSGHAPDAPRSRRRAKAIPGPPCPTRGQSTKLAHTGSILYRLALARMLKQIAAVSPPRSFPRDI